VAGLIVFPASRQARSLGAQRILMR